MRAAARDARAARERGFTLLEMILVLLLAALLAALVAPAVPGTLESSRLRRGAAEVRATFSAARTASASAGREMSVLLDLESGEYGIAGAGRPRPLPEGIRIRSIRVGDTLAEWERPFRETGPRRVRFFPDGGAEEAEVVLTSEGGGSLRVVVDPLTGMAEAGT